MESSALNIAHETVRRAKALTREGRLKEALDCHEQAAELFMQVHRQITNNLVDNPQLMHSDPISMTLESLSLQHEHHIRQAKILRMKQVQLDEYKRTLQKKPAITVDKIPDRLQKDMASAITEGYLKLAIYKTIEEQDSLLNLMSMSDDKNAFKHPKDTGTVIEELRTVNKHLRSLVGSLLGKLETKENEVRILKERLQSVTPEANVDALLAETTSLPPLPPLAPLPPLGMPHFDFSSFVWPVSTREPVPKPKQEEEDEEPVLPS